MNTQRIYLLLATFVLGLLITSNVSPQGPTVAYVGDKKVPVPVRNEETKKAIPKIVKSKITSRKSEVIGIDDIEELAKYYGLARWINTQPPSSFISCWYNQKLSKKELSIQFAALELVLTAAERQGINIPEKEKLCSAPKELIAAIQTELVEVPDLSGLSRAEAEDKLRKIGLVSAAKTQHDQNTESGRVIRGSQEPESGIIVEKKDVVSFKVAVHLVSLNLNNNDIVHCSRSDDGVYRFSVDGKVSDLSTEKVLLLWVRPRLGPHVWYLQGPPANGIINVGSDGSWQGIGQIGNIQYPPKSGDILDVAVTLVDTETAKTLLGRLEMSGVVTQTNLPRTISAIASSVHVEL